MDSLQWKTLLKWMILENPYPVETFLWSHDPSFLIDRFFSAPDFSGGTPHWCSCGRADLTWRRKTTSPKRWCHKHVRCCPVLKWKKMKVYSCEIPWKSTRNGGFNGNIPYKWSFRGKIMGKSWTIPNKHGKIMEKARKHSINGSFNVKILENPQEMSVFMGFQPGNLRKIHEALRLEKSWKLPFSPPFFIRPWLQMSWLHALETAVGVKSDWWFIVDLTMKNGGSFHSS